MNYPQFPHMGQFPVRQQMGGNGGASQMQPGGMGGPTPPIMAPGQMPNTQFPLNPMPPQQNGLSGGFGGQVPQPMPNTQFPLNPMQAQQQQNILAHPQFMQNHMANDPNTPATGGMMQAFSDFRNAKADWRGQMPDQQAPNSQAMSDWRAQRPGGMNFLQGLLPQFGQH